MAMIQEARDGWINFLPGVDEDAAPPPPSGLGAILAPRTPGAVMATWAPETQTRRGVQGATVGLLHPAGRFASRQLASLGVPLPEGWVVRQDNPRRGLIVMARLDAPYTEVLDWIVSAGTTLSMLPYTGSWRADVYFPKILPIS
jgi:hypothetical protein